jgi:hypothetical protein
MPDPYRSRLRVEIGSIMVSVIPVRRTGRPQIDIDRRNLPAA